jgi:hypothetical protein
MSKDCRVKLSAVSNGRVSDSGLVHYMSLENTRRPSFPVCSSKSRKKAHQAVPKYIE